MNTGWIFFWVICYALMGFGLGLVLEQGSIANACLKIGAFSASPYVFECKERT